MSKLITNREIGGIEKPLLSSTAGMQWQQPPRNVPILRRFEKRYVRICATYLCLIFLQLRGQLKTGKKTRQDRYTQLDPSMFDG